MNIFISTRDGKKLPAVINKPQSDRKKFPVILFVVGLGMDLHEWNHSHDEIADRLVKAGFMTLQFSFSIFYPGGGVVELPLDKRSEQLQDVYDWLHHRDEVDAQRVGIHATSFGVPTVLSARLTGVKVFVFVSGAYFPAPSIQRVYSERGVSINYQGETTLPHSTGEPTTVGADFWPSVAGFSFVSSVAEMTQPILMVHGDRDTKITASEARQAFAGLPGKERKLRMFSGGDHGFTDVSLSMRAEFLDEVVGWFNHYL